MKRYIYSSLISIIVFCTSFITAYPPDTRFEVRILASGLSDPWSVVWGPEGRLWVTETKGYRVLRIDPGSGRRSVVLDLNAEREFPAFGQLRKSGMAAPQGGLMGLALHPDFLKGKPFVYLSYVYKYLQGNQFLLKIARYSYDKKTDQLVSPVVICDSIPASNDHNGGRMLIAPAGGTPYLFYAVGDQGSGQFRNGGRVNKAQALNSYEGKILRFNLEPHGAGGWLPQDNPVAEGKSAVWTSGHRNPQGLAFTMLQGKERLYSSEHGPYSDDEINLIEKGRNYGHPLVIGYKDGNYNGLAAAVSDEESYPGKWHTTYPLIRDEKRNADSIGAAFREPVKSLYPTSNAELAALFKTVRSGDKGEWAAYAPSGIAVYKSAAIPGWQQSLLVTSLKAGKLLRLKLRPDGSVEPGIFEYVPSRARYRDVTVSSDGLKIYLATDSSAITSGPTAEDPKATSYRGCILELRYVNSAVSK